MARITWFDRYDGRVLHTNWEQLPPLQAEDKRRTRARRATKNLFTRSSSGHASGCPSTIEPVSYEEWGLGPSDFTPPQPRPVLFKLILKNLSPPKDLTAYVCPAGCCKSFETEDHTGKLIHQVAVRDSHTNPLSQVQKSATKGDRRQRRVRKADIYSSEPLHPAFDQDSSSCQKASPSKRKVKLASSPIPSVYINAFCTT
ncbi:hypothetical protein DL96DRAFT_1717318 [Flagelloscypha sp. PMI_526]|nr:hypothetical protein DL96DRAFT_1717318 [Flagelloscypha sp. PMI_526]